MKRSTQSRIAVWSIVIALFVILICISKAVGATKQDLRDKLVATGNYLEVGEAVPLRFVQGQAGMAAKRYYVAVLEPTTDSLVAYQKSIYIWVVNDGDSTEAAYFLDRDPTIPAPVPTNFRNLVKARMVTLGVEGTIMEQGAIGNKEWALVDRYQAGSGANTFKVTKYKITRTDGTTWSIESLEF